VRVQTEDKLRIVVEDENIKVIESESLLTSKHIIKMENE